MAYQNLVEEILNELLFQRSGSEESMEVGSQEFRDEIAAAIVRKIRQLSDSSKQAKFLTYLRAEK